EAAREYLSPIIAAGADTGILGCTHYPFLLGALSKVAGSKIVFIDPPSATIRTLMSALKGAGLLARTRPPSERPLHRLATTGDVRAFEAQLAASWPHSGKTVEHLVFGAR